MFGQSVNAISAINPFEDHKKVKHEEQPQVAFINSVFDNFGGNSSGTEASFNA
ncbi:MAG: hypothetical protein ACI37S_00665 [Candidatus Gastranaerophilaceae bacterium]